jgi:death on curing protein
MDAPKWLSERIVLAIHDQQIAEHGGSPGLRDPGLLDSALNRPLNTHAYIEGSSLFDLAADYGFGLAKNHAFIDGNKRVAFMAMYVFLRINGFALNAPEEEAAHFMMRLAAGDESRETLADWLKNAAIEVAP